MNKYRQHYQVQLPTNKRAEIILDVLTALVIGVALAMLLAKWWL